jgi:hypothetical protein
VKNNQPDISQELFHILYPTYQVNYGLREPSRSFDFREISVSIGRGAGSSEQFHGGLWYCRNLQNLLPHINFKCLFTTFFKEKCRKLKGRNVCHLQIYGNII